MSDKETLAVYAEAAQRYSDGFKRTKDLDQADDIARLNAVLPEGALVLDLGCGPGQYADALQKAGFTVEGMDASPEMVALAKRDFGIDARVGLFDDLDAEGRYAAIWANFSLLHAPQEQFPDLLARIRRALIPGGWLHLGMKLGQGEARDPLGRFYAYYSEDDLRERLTRAGFQVTHARTGSGTGLAGTPDSYVILLAHA